MLLCQFFEKQTKPPKNFKYPITWEEQVPQNSHSVLQLTPTLTSSVLKTEKQMTLDPICICRW